ncbi:hypothetical protein LBMAG44_12350 [Gemmatimonadota bacterium]|nr:hypothetical protein LBMAG44_12350 [Gemmatimonadota bacterium]
MTHLREASTFRAVDDFKKFLLVAPVLLLSMVAHEYAHGFAALKQGDDTAESLGRLTWNPLKHIDPWLTIVMPLVTFFGSGGSMAFGGAKPVPVDPTRYANYVRGDIIVSLAGIAANILLAALFMLVIVGLGLLGRVAPALTDTVALLQVMTLYGIWINVILAWFNLMPIPPLDGSHVIKHLLPGRIAIAYQRLSRFGLLIVLALVSFAQPVLSAWMMPARWLIGHVTTIVLPYLSLGRWSEMLLS